MPIPNSYKRFAQQTLNFSKKAYPRTAMSITRSTTSITRSTNRCLYAPRPLWKVLKK